MPTEPVSQQLWKLMRLNFNIRQLIGTVELLGEVPWTTLPAEQQHASLALLHKWHPGYGPDTLISRALLLQFMKLLPTTTKDEKQKAGVLRRMDVIMRANPDKVTGRHMMCASMIAIFKGRKEEGRAGYEANMRNLAKHCFTRQSVMWANMGIRQQMEWSQRARMHAAERREDLEEHWQRLHRELGEIEDKMAERHSRGDPMSMTSAALSERDLVCFADLWSQEQFRSAANINARRATVCTAPIPQPLLPGPDPWMYKDPKMPQWALPLIRNRELLQGTALEVLRDNGQAEYWKFVFMVKSSGLEFLAMTPLIPADEHLPSTALAEPRESLYRFRCNFADFRTAADVVVGAADRLNILLRLYHNGGTYMSSDMYPIGIPWLLAGQAADMPKGVDEEQRARKAAKTFDEYAVAMPWLQHLDVKQGFSGGFDALTPGGSAASQDIESSAAEYEVNEEDFLDALGMLDKERIVAADENAYAGQESFASKVRGGESQFAKTGDMTHAHQSQCTNKYSTAWARRRGLHITFKATHGPHGLAQAKLMCRSWCHRMQIFIMLRKSLRMAQT